MNKRKNLARVTAATALSLLACICIAQSIVSTARVSQNEAGAGQNGSAGRPSLSANGQIFSFSSTADNLVVNDTNNRADVFVGSIGTAGLRRISVGKFGIQANGGSFNPSVSPQAPNGFVAVAYASDASNIGRGLLRFPDNNNERDIYYSLPLRRNFTKRVTYGVGGEAPNGPSRNPSTTIVPEPNRLLVAYQSAATNLVSNDTNNATDIFLTSIQKAENSTDDDDSQNEVVSGYSNTKISIPNDPSLESNGASTDPEISGNGSIIVYESTATNLVPGLTPAAKQIYAYDLSKGTTELISKGTDGSPGNADSFNATVSYQGTFIAYCTAASNILADNKTVIAGSLQVVLYNRITKRSVRVNVSNSGEPGNGAIPTVVNADINPTGRLVFFSDLATNLVNADANGSSDVFARDLVNLLTSRISTGFDGSESNGNSASVTIGQRSFTSTEILSAYLSTATNLISGDAEEREDVFTSTFQIPPATYVRGTVLEVPADVTPSPNSASMTLQKFKVTKSRMTSARATPRTPKVEYSVTVYRENPDLTRSDTRRKTSTRANVTFRNLPPGVYVSQYRTQLNTSGKITNKSKLSPPARFAVGTPTPIPSDE